MTNSTIAARPASIRASADGTGVTRAPSGQPRQYAEDGTPINPAFAWTTLAITSEMQALADAIFANSAARQPIERR